MTPRPMRLRAESPISQASTAVRPEVNIPLPAPARPRALERALPTPGDSCSLATTAAILEDLFGSAL